MWLNGSHLGDFRPLRDLFKLGFWGEITFALGMIYGIPSQEPGSVHLSTLKESTQAWLTDRKIKGFYTGLSVSFFVCVFV